MFQLHKKGSSLGPMQLIMSCHLILLSICIIASFTSTFTTVTADSYYTNQYCNYTLYPKTGCEDDVGAECIDTQCRCKSGRTLYQGRFCLIKICSDGDYYDEHKGRCEAKKRASSSVAESNCRYDYQCLGNHVHCKLYGWNRNCVCDSGFVYGFNGTCIPMFGIGGHCARDTDCDNTDTRRMLCEVKDESKRDGTCQCLPDHTYNYHVDGCESNERIHERKHNMRMLIILFVIAGGVFGFALTFNFGFFAASPRQQQAMLLKRLAEEKERQLKQQQDRLKSAEEGQNGATAPPIEEEQNKESDTVQNNKTEDSQKKSADDKRRYF